MRFILSVLIPMMLVVGCGNVCTPVDYVNPYMGNISHLLVPTYPTVHLPNSMMRAYPERADFTSDRMKGLPLIVTSHRGRSAFNLSFFQGDMGDVRHCYEYHYDNERITPYSYDVYFEDENVEASFSPAGQSAIYRLNFLDEGTVILILNAEAGKVSFVDGLLKGYQYIDEKTRIFICAEFSSPVIDLEIRNSDGHNFAVLSFGDNIDSISMRYGVSLIDEEQAEANMHRETDGETVGSLREKGKRLWNTKLGKIIVSGTDEDAKTVFYTSLYRTYERMVCISEDGRYYSAFDGNVHEDSMAFYTDDWIWDTYRAVHPLRILIEPEMEIDMINSFMRMAEQSENKWMATFPEVTGDSRRMNSNHGVAVIADAVSKGLDGFELEDAYIYCRDGITEKTLAPWSDYKGGGLSAFYWKHGYIPALAEGEKETLPEVDVFERRQPIAVTLGTAYDTWCLSVIADRLNRTEEAEYFAEKSLNYRNVFNHETLFFHPKDADGRFIKPFDYELSGGIGARNAYGENNGWVYRWDVPHNIPDLVALMGGKKAFSAELDRMYNTPLSKSKYEFYAQLPDHTGNVGQFSMANEPSMHIPYLYVYSGEPWKTQKRVRTLLAEWFRNDLMGVPGDEDGGGTSAFVVFSMLGFYPIAPGLPLYVIGSPVFENAEIQLGNGKTFTINCKNYAPDHKYVQSAKLNGKGLDRSWFTHEELIEGGELEFVMGDRPNKEWGTENTPPVQIAPSSKGQGCPSVGKKSFSFVQISDPQFGFREENGYEEAEEMLEATVRTINELKPEFVIVTGDMVNDSGNKAQLKAYRSTISKIDKDIPVYHIPGNHDIGQNTEDGTENYINDYGSDRFSFRTGDRAFIGINSSLIIDPAACELEKGQYQWLENQLKANEDCRLVFVFSHHPVVFKSMDEEEGYSNFPMNMRKKYMALFSEYGVDAVLSGHLHNTSRCIVDGVDMITTGPSCKALGTGYPGLAVIHVDGEEYKYGYMTNEEVLKTLK